MSSVKNKQPVETSLLKSSVFRWCFMMGMCFGLVVLLMAMVSAQLSWYYNEKVIKNEMLEESEGLYELFQEEGLDVLIADINGFEEDEDDEEELTERWSHERLFDIYEEGEWAYRISSTFQETITGFDFLSNKKGWRQTVLDEEELILPMITYTKALDDEHVLTVGRFMEAGDHLLSFISEHTVIFLIIVLTLSCLIAAILHHVIQKQLNIWSEAMNKVAAGHLDERLALKTRNDEFNHLSAQINITLDGIQKLNKHIKNVSAGIAHDLKTPISHLNGRLQLLSQDIKDEAKAQKHIAVAENQIDNIIRTFEALLRLAEIESGDRRKQFKKFSLSKLLEDVVDGYTPLFADHEKKLDVSIVPGITLNGDADLIAQLVSNLLENILEHARHNARAWLRLQATARGAVLQIGDDGPGIPEPYREQVFERFFRMDASRNTPGNGLGLSLVKSICELHHAKIMLLPQQNGSVFDVQFVISHP